MSQPEEVQPPQIYGLEWRQHPPFNGVVEWEADCTSEFTHAKTALGSDHPLPRCIGSAEKNVVMRSDRYDRDEVVAWVAALAEAVERYPLVKAAEADRRRREQREHLWNNAGAPFHAYVKTVRAEAEAELARWGLAFKSSAKAREILADDIMLHGDVKSLRKLIDDNKKKQSGIADRVAMSGPRGVECDDDTVERAIILLTELDEDERELPNREGWGGSTGPGGHWCYAMLRVDRPLAIKEGRRLIALGKHEAQLLRLGIDVGDDP